LITQNHHFALTLHHATAPFGEPAFTVLAYQRCLLGFGLAAFRIDDDCAYALTFGLPHVDLPKKHGRFSAKLVGYLLDYGEFYLDDRRILQSGN